MMMKKYDGNDDDEWLIDWCDVLMMKSEKQWPMIMMIMMVSNMTMIVIMTNNDDV